MRHTPHDIWHDARHHMVRRYLAGRGLADRRVLAAIAAVPRHDFVPEHFYDRAYEDQPLPAGHGQTISQPYIVGLMTHEARLNRRAAVLDVGTGTGYQAAILALLSRHVWTVERIPELSRGAARRLDQLGIRNVTFIVGDGAEGHAAAAPYDAIIVAAAVPAVPPALFAQMADRGRLVVPIGDRAEQNLFVYERTAAGITARDAGPCRFVPLISPQGFSEDS
jgi:protein-L-isoaspartate(D-aspartate) O-methyltransferase